MIKTTINPDGTVVIAATTKTEGQILLEKLYNTETSQEVEETSPLCNCSSFGQGIICRNCRPDIQEVFDRETWNSLGDNSTIHQVSDGQVEVMWDD